MKRLFKLVQFALLLIAVAASLTYWQFRSPEPAALQAFINANVITVDADDTLTEALLVEGDKIIDVGTSKQITSKITL